MTTYKEIIRDAAAWIGVLDPSLLISDKVVAGHRPADAAKLGHCNMAMTVLNNQKQWVTVNQWRPGGITWFTLASGRMARRDPGRV